MTDHITQIRLSDLAESPTNPRKHFDDDSLRELARSIVSQGVLQPIIVRPITRRDDDDGAAPSYEIVAGHRRYRATHLTDLETIPAIVRVMSDADVAMAQLVENMARQDVTALEEADAMRRAVDELGLSVDMLMEQTGKSKTYVYGRLKLSSASADVRIAIQQGLSPEAGLLVARMPEAVQAVAVNRLKTTGSDGTVVWHSYRQTKQVLGNLSSPLANAPWPIDWIPIGHPTACSECVQNTRNTPSLAEALGADVCTRTSCAEGRWDAWRGEQIAQARAEGRLLEGEEKSKAGANTWPGANFFGDYINTSFPIWSIVKRAVPSNAHGTPTLADAIKELRSNQLRAHEIPPTRMLVLDGHDECMPIDLVSRPESVRIAEIYAEVHGIELLIPNTAPPPHLERYPTKGAGAAKVDTRSPEEKAVADHGLWSKTKGLMIQSARSRGRSRDDLLLIVAAMYIDGEIPEKTLDMLGIVLPDGGDPRELMGILEALGNDALSEILICAGIEKLGLSWRFDDAPEAMFLVDLARRYGVDALTGERVENSPPAADGQEGGSSPPAAEMKESDASGAGGGLAEDARDTRTLDIFDAHPDALPGESEAAPADPVPAQPRWPSLRQVAYRDPVTGDAWSGRGLKPKWLAVQLEAGKTLADFEVKQVAA